MNPLNLYKPEFLKEKIYVTIIFLNNDSEDYFKVELVDYGLKGIIPISCLTKKKKIKSMNKVAPLNKELPALVESYDINKNIVTLSRKYIDKNSQEYSLWNNEKKSKKLIISLIKSSAKKLERDEKYFYDNIITPISQLRFDENSQLNLFDYLKKNLDKLKLQEDVKNIVTEFLNYKKPIKTINYLSNIGLIAKSSLDDTQKQILQILEKYPNLDLKLNTVPYFVLSSTSDNSEPNDHHLFVNELKMLENKTFNLQVKELVTN